MGDPQVLTLRSFSADDREECAGAQLGVMEEGNFDRGVCGLLRRASESLPLGRQSFRFASHISPADLQVANRAGLTLGLENVEHLEQDAALDVAVKRGAEMVSHRPWNEDCAWQLQDLRGISSDRHGDGRDSSLFDCSLNQSDRLMTDWSGRGEQRNVCPLLFGDCSCNVFHHGGVETLRVHVVADEAEEVRRQLADDSLG